MKVSAIVPAHITQEEQVKWLFSCIHSLYQIADEIVVMDDASTLPLQSVTQQFDNVSLYRTDVKQGVSRARNLAVEKAKNHVIFPIDCDDLVIPTAFEAMINAFDGMPLYPDLIKLYPDGTEKRHIMMDFDCGAIEKYVIASVNVLHLKQHWKHLKGWDEEVEYIEDGEYNARLLYIYCGKRFPEPVVKYRQHQFQRTKLYANEHEKRLRDVVIKVRSYNMPGCCGGKKVNKTVNVPKTKVNTTPKTAFASQQGFVQPRIPGEVEGLVLVKYVGGKGKGKHYYRGPSTGFNYKVQFGQFINVDPADANSGTLFEIVRKVQPKPVKVAAKPVAPRKVAPKKVEKKEPVVEETVERVPVVEEDVEVEIVEDEDEFIDMTELLDDNYRVVIANLEEFKPTQEEAMEILEAEKQGKNRKKVVGWLENRL